MKKKLCAVMAACLVLSATVPFAACKGPSTGDKEKGDRTVITFACGNKSTERNAWLELIKAYNDGEGYEKDNVYVDMTLARSANSNDFTKSMDASYNVMMVDDSKENGFINIAETVYKSGDKCVMLDLSKYAAADDDFKNSTIPENVLNWWRYTYNSQADKGSGKPKHIRGVGQSLLGVPISTNPHFNWYNEAMFKAQGINIVSVPEEELDSYNQTNNATLKPHGYAEYLNAPVAGMTKSKNLDGKEVYKVFNNCIGMNWEEQRNILKYFTKSYNDGSKTGKAATTDFGFVSEYWFNYGWSVGGDVVGYNGTDYDFTLLDTHKNYIVTKSNTVINGVTYSAGEIVRYEDRVKALDNAATTPDGVYAIESQYNAVKEYVSLQVATDVIVDTRDGKTYKGYGVADPETGRADQWFNNGELAMTRGSELTQEKMLNNNFNICVPETYREYEGGSVYYNGGEDYAHEYLKVIGETYDGTVYTGDIKKVDGTPIIGNSTTASISKALVIPANSDPEKYQASWDFISWVATEGQKYIAKTTGVPVASKTAFGEDYAKNTEISRGKNLYAVAKMSANAATGDWGYFTNGEWVSNWSSMFNDEVRRGRATLSKFENSKSQNAKDAVNDMVSIIKGIR